MKRGLCSKQSAYYIVGLIESIRLGTVKVRERQVNLLKII